MFNYISIWQHFSYSAESKEASQEACCAVELASSTELRLWKAPWQERTGGLKTHDQLPAWRCGKSAQSLSCLPQLSAMKFTVRIPNGNAYTPCSHSPAASNDTWWCSWILWILHTTPSSIGISIPIDAIHLFLYMTLTCLDISEGEPKPIKYVQDAWYQKLFMVTAFAIL